MKRCFVAAVILTLILCLSPIAQATFSTDNEYMVVFQQGITWDQAAAQVAGWGDSFHLATITSPQEERYVDSLLKGLKGEFWVGSLQDSSSHQWERATGEPRVYTHWEKREPWSDSDPGSAGHPALWSGPNSGFGSYMWRWNNWGWNNWRLSAAKWSDWRWNDEGDPRHIAGFIVERDQRIQPAATPVPPAVWLLGSGLAMIAGVRVSWRNRRRAGSRLARRQAI